jgi:hypothetical protein
MKLVPPAWLLPSLTKEADQFVAFEKRNITSADHPSSHRKSCLEFPSFARNILMQPAWQLQNPHGRVNIMLSEQLISKNGGKSEPDRDIANDIVCFSFQHAPRGEQMISNKVAVV